MDIQIVYDEASVSNFQQTLNRFIANSTRAAAVVVRQQSKLLAEDFMLATGPWAKGRPSNGLDAKRMGTEAAKRDLLKAITPITSVLDLKNTTNKRLKKQIKQLVDTQDINEAEALFKNFKKLNSWKFSDAIREYDSRLRVSGNRYRLRNYRKVATLDVNQWKSQLQRIQANVGLAKAGWAVSVAALGGKVPGWISNLIGRAYGRCIVNLDNPTPSVEMINSTNNIGRYTREYNRAMNLRAEAMQKQMAYYIEQQIKQQRLN